MREKRKKLSPFKERISTSFEAIGWVSSFLAFGWVKGTNSNQFCNFPCLACDFRRVGPPCCAQGFKFQNLNLVDSTRVILGPHTRRACRVWAFGLLLGFGPSDMAEWLNGLLPGDFYSAHLKRVGWPSMVNGPLLFILKIKNTKENTSKVTRKTIMYKDNHGTSSQESLFRVISLTFVLISSCLRFLKVDCWSLGNDAVR